MIRVVSVDETISHHRTILRIMYKYKVILQAWKMWLYYTTPKAQRLSKVCLSILPFVAHTDCCMLRSHAYICTYVCIYKTQSMHIWEQCMPCLCYTPPNCHIITFSIPLVYRYLYLSSWRKDQRNGNVTSLDFEMKKSRFPLQNLFSLSNISFLFICESERV